MWKHVENSRHKDPLNTNGLLVEIMSNRNTDVKCICKRCYKVFTNEKSCAVHKVYCFSKATIKRVQTTSYSCKKCGKSTIVKSVAARHFRQRQGVWRGRKVDLDELGVTKMVVEVNMANYNELRIGRKLFTETSLVFHEAGDTRVKGLCTFQVEARKEIDEHEPIISDIYFSTITEELHLITFQDTASIWMEVVS